MGRSVAWRSMLRAVAGCGIIARRVVSAPWAAAARAIATCQSVGPPAAASLDQHSRLFHSIHSFFVLMGSRLCAAAHKDGVLVTSSC